VVFAREPQCPCHHHSSFGTSHQSSPELELGTWKRSALSILVPERATLLLSPLCYAGFCRHPGVQQVPCIMHVPYAMHVSLCTHPHPPSVVCPQAPTNPFSTDPCGSGTGWRLRGTQRKAGKGPWPEF
jgi:hypothetical protein